MPPRGRQMFHTFKESEKAGPYDEHPMLPPGVDPQLHLSRNDRPQPFYLICGKDCVLVQMSGRGQGPFRGGVRCATTRLSRAISSMCRPACPTASCPRATACSTATRPPKPGWKALPGIATSCGAEVHRQIWDTAKTVPQRGYIEACAAFSGSDDARTCSSCGAIHDKVDFDTARWQEIAETFSDA